MNIVISTTLQFVASTCDCCIKYLHLFLLRLIIGIIKLYCHYYCYLYNSCFTAILCHNLENCNFTVSLPIIFFINYWLSISYWSSLIFLTLYLKNLTEKIV